MREVMKLKTVTARDFASEPDLVAWDVMYRFFLTSDIAIVPTRGRKAASGTDAGVHLLPPGMSGLWNHASAMLCKYLRGVYENGESSVPGGSIPGHLVRGKDQFMTMSDESLLGELVEAALGAADANLAFQEFLELKSDTWKRSPLCVRAGHVEGDYITTSIVDWLTEFLYGGGCREECRKCHPGGYNPTGCETPVRLRRRQSKLTQTDPGGCGEPGNRCRFCNDPDRAADANPAPDLDAAEEPIIDAFDLLSEERGSAMVAKINADMAVMGDPANAPEMWQDAQRTAAGDAETSPAEANNMETDGGGTDARKGFPWREWKLWHQQSGAHGPYLYYARQRSMYDLPETQFGKSVITDLVPGSSNTGREHHTAGPAARADHVMRDRSTGTRRSDTVNGVEPSTVPTTEHDGEMPTVASKGSRVGSPIEDRDSSGDDDLAQWRSSHLNQ